MVIDCAKVKKNCVVYYKRFQAKKYNEKSKENLKQNTDQQISKNKFLTILNKQTEIDDINTFTKNYKTAYESISGKKYKTALSVQQAKQISERTDVFISSILSSYCAKSGYKQRSVNFVTLTLPQAQMHTDKTLIKTLTKFLDHLKKVKNYLVENGENSKVELLPLQNYLWRAETMENGNLHFHILFDTYFSMVTLKNTWNNYLTKLGYINGQNAAQIHAIANLKDVGAYVTKYMTKEPYNDLHNNEKRVKNGLQPLTNDELAEIPDDVKFRRSVIGKTWGCSRGVMALKYPVFEETHLYEVDELKKQLTPVDLPAEVPDFIKVYKGKISEILKTSKMKLGKTIKKYYHFIFKSLYQPEIFQVLKDNLTHYQNEYYLHTGKMDYLKNQPDFSFLQQPKPTENKQNPYTGFLFY